jgi:hypothetical protein
LEGIFGNKREPITSPKKYNNPTASCAQPTRLGLSESNSQEPEADILQAPAAMAGPGNDPVQGFRTKRGNAEPFSQGNVE